MAGAASANPSLPEIVQASAQEAKSGKKQDDSQSLVEQQQEEEDSNSMDVDNGSNNKEDEMTQMMNMMGLKSNGFGKGAKNGNQNRKRNNQGKSAAGHLGRNRKAPSQNLRLYARQLQIWDFLSKEDLPMLRDGDFKIFARPEGDRCIIFSGNGITIARG